MGYKVDEADDIKKRKENWESGKVKVGEIQKKPVEEMGYKVDEADDIRKRKENWESGKVKVGEIQKKPVEEMGYRVDDSEDIRKRKDEWEKGKTGPTVSKSSNPGDVGYKVETEGVKDRLNKWKNIGNTTAIAPSRKEPVKIPEKKCYERRSN